MSLRLWTAISAVIVLAGLIVVGCRRLQTQQPPALPPNATQQERELAEAKRELDWTRDTLQKRIEADRAHVRGQANLASTLTKEAGNGRG